ncbi:hypothetical protein P8452_25952 [Trifolium repens]|nr:hypothetical protein P8452_25952 [Trifolium repens]
MAELIAGAFLSSVFQVTLERFASRDFKDLFNKRLVEKLEITLNSINQVLDDAETKQYQNQNVKNWLDHLKHEIYEVDQLLDEIATYAQRKSKVQLFLSALTNRFESRIKDLLDKLKFLAEQKDVVKAENPIHNEVKTSRIEGEILESNNLKCFTLNEVKTATRNFHPDGLVGEGGFGSVFKGWIDDEHTLAPTKPGTDFVIAVKRLYQETNKGLSKWLTEINYLGQLRHPNLVKLIGYCFEDEHQILVYEFLTKGSLDNHLFGRVSNFQPLSWKIRMKIALDVAKGLAFLHRDEVGVIYRYFKTSKILIDSNYNAKLSVFGLEKDRPEDDTMDSEVVFIGTTVYIAPEYLLKDHSLHIVNEHFGVG